MREANTHAHEPQAVAIDHERYHRLLSLAALLVGIAALVFALSLLVYLLWLMLSPTTATPFDADGVRCYGRALTLACLKTANP
jgi:hypothetical protein